MNILIEKFKQRNEISTIFLYILYFLLGMYYPLFSFMRQTVPQYWNQVTLFYHILLIQYDSWRTYSWKSKNSMDMDIACRLYLIVSDTLMPSGAYWSGYNNMRNYKADKSHQANRIPCGRGIPDMQNPSGYLPLV